MKIKKSFKSKRKSIGHMIKHDKKVRKLYEFYCRPDIIDIIGNEINRPDYHPMGEELVKEALKELEENKKEKINK